MGSSKLVYITYEPATNTVRESAAGKVTVAEALNGMIVVGSRI
jgi:hypothetical protein